MKRTSTQGINEQNNKGIMRLSLLLTLLFVLLLSFTSTSYANDGTELIKAAKKGDVSKVNELLDKGADVDARNEWGSTALIMASQEGHKEIMQLLREAGAR